MTKSFLKFQTVSFVERESIRPISFALGSQLLVTVQGSHAAPDVMVAMRDDELRRKRLLSSYPKKRVN